MKSFIELYLILKGLKGGGGGEPGKFDSVEGDVVGIAGTVTLTEFELQ